MSNNRYCLALFLSFCLLLISTTSNAKLSLLHYYAIDNESERILKIVDSESVSKTDGDGWTPLHYAIFFRSMEAAEALIKIGADVNARLPNKSKYIPGDLNKAINAVDNKKVCTGRSNRKGKWEFWGRNNPLGIAIRCRNKAMVSLLLKHGADSAVPVYYYDSGKPESALDYAKWHHANRGGPESIVAMLNLSPLHYHAIANESERILKIVDSELASKTDGGGLTPLHYAVFFGNIEAVEALIKIGADVNARPPDLQNAHSDLVLFTIRSGAGIITYKGCMGHSTRVEGAAYYPGDIPLSFAIGCQDEAMVSLLLKHRADTAALVKYKLDVPPISALSFAEKHGSPSIVAMIRKDQLSPPQLSPLHHYAIANESERILKIVDSELVSKTDGDGWTPLHYAIFFRSVEAAEALIKIGADVNARVTNKLGGWHR